jgi:hypothetical protein
MRNVDAGRYTGITAALAAAMLFGAGTPLAKLLLTSVSPWLLAGLLYLGSGLGLTLYRWLSKAAVVKLSHRETAWFAGAIVSAGVVAPVRFNAGNPLFPWACAPWR